MITAQQVKELRTRTGCGVVDCQAALQEAAGDVDAAITLLRKKGKAKANKKADRATAEGVVTTYIHSNHKVGVLLSLYCETDFVARTDKFKDLAHDIALHIAAAEPLVVDPADVSEAAVAEERNVAEEQARQSGKPEAIQAKIIEGKLDSFRKERALLTQPFIKDPGKTVGDLLKEAVGELGENISVGQFSRIAI